MADPPPFPIFHVKRTLPTNADGTLQQDDLRIMRDTRPLPTFICAPALRRHQRDQHHGTHHHRAVDVKDVDTSADGKRVVRHARPLTQNQQTKDPPSWRVYECVIATDTCTR